MDERTGPVIISSSVLVYDTSTASHLVRKVRVVGGEVIKPTLDVDGVEPNWNDFQVGGILLGTLQFDYIYHVLARMDNVASRHRQFLCVLFLRKARDKLPNLSSGQRWMDGGELRKAMQNGDCHPNLLALLGLQSIKP